MRYHYNDHTLSDENINKIIKKNNVGLDHTQLKNFTRIMLDGKTYFVKTINIKRGVGEGMIDNEIKPSIQFVNLIQKYNKYSVLFPHIYAILQMGVISYYIMEDIRIGDLIDMLPLLNKDHINDFLLQSLVGIYVFNHRLKMFHNDIYYRDTIRNVMVHKNSKLSPNNIIQIKLNKSIITIPIKEYCIKIIDFGRSSKIPEFRTTEYHQKYFPQLKYISEVLLFAYFFFKTMNEDISHLINDIIKSIENCDSLKEFDEKFIINIIKKLNIKIHESYAN